MPGTPRSHLARRAGGFAAIALSVACFAPSLVMANGLYENRSWQFQTTADKTNKAFVTDMIEKKKGGYYDAATVNVTNNNTTNVAGDQINCGVTSSAVGNSSASGMDSVTSSPTVAPGSDILADSTGNQADNASGGKAPSLNNDQLNSGDQSSVVDVTASTGQVDASGGTTKQTLNNDQVNTGNQTASVDGSIGCTFDYKGKSGQAALN